MRTLILAAMLAAATAPLPATAAELPSPALDGSVGPNLFAAADGRVLLSWIDRADGGRDALRYSFLGGDGWSEPRLVAAGAGWFVNWADFPSVVALPDGSLAAHWLVKTGDAPYAYEIRVARSTDGAAWGAPVVPHRDGTPTEHGFVSLFAAQGGGLAAAWLDGRETGPRAGHGEGRGAMTLRTAVLGTGGRIREEALLDAQVCDCCQTSAALTSEGPILAYRDRSEREVRDISVVRLRDGRWDAPQGLAADGWQIDGCPVNGPAAAARGRRAAVAWFTAANGVSRVKLAFSDDAGGSFSAPVTVDDGQPLGRVDAVLLDDGSAIVSWVESTSAGRVLRARRVHPGGERGAAVDVVPPDDRLSRSFPQMALDGGQLVFAWTAGRVRTAVVPLARFGP